ncbi:MAG: CBS domain-containing protein [Phycisphaerae bacterium]|nr:CBS domain-containing protein [Phycisphaerae bacterium]
MPCAIDILKTKGSTVHWIAPTATVLDAIQKMNMHKLGALVVMDQGRVVGMFTERDVLTRVMGRMLDPKEAKVSDVMSSDIIYVAPMTDIDEISAFMQQRRIRHLPVISEEGDLFGLISIGDLNAFHASNQEMTIHYLSEYIYGRA